MRPSFLSNQPLRLGLLSIAALVLLGCEKNSPASSTVSDRSEVYTIGTTVTFGSEGTGLSFEKDGWSNPEEGHVWSDRQKATISLRLPDNTTGPLHLRLKLQGLVKSPELPFQPVEVWINGVKVAEWQVAQLADYSAEISTDLLQSKSSLVIDLRIPKAASPKKLGLSPDDDRTLGIALSELQLNKGDR